MARRCHRQERGTQSIFVGEQFWGRAARASWTRKSSGRSLFLGYLFSRCRSRDSSFVLVGRGPALQFVEIVKLTVILA